MPNEKDTHTKSNLDNISSMQLLERYDSIFDILIDPYGRIFAHLQEMHYGDWLDFHIKNFIIRNRFLNQPVSIIIDDKKVELLHPITKQKLIYADFITDRSGPKFGGYLDETVGEEYLERHLSDNEVKKLTEDKKTGLIHYCIENNIKTPSDEWIDKALSIYAKKHPTQRKLSDFDLTAINLKILEQSITCTLAEQKLLSEPDINELYRKPELRSEIAKTAWQEGGTIDTALIKNCINGGQYSKRYRLQVKESMRLPQRSNNKPASDNDTENKKDFTHMLISGPGETIRQEYKDFYRKVGVEAPVFDQDNSSGMPDTFYGLGIPFVEASIESVEDGLVTLSLDHEHTEIGDIICDNSSIFGHVFNLNAIFNKSMTAIYSLTLEYQIYKEDTDVIIENAMNKAKKKGKGQNFVYEKTLENICSDSSLPDTIRDGCESVLQDYRFWQKIMRSGLVFEEVGKKEAQSQLFFETGNNKKLIGNISDVTPFIIGATKIIADKSDTYSNLDKEIANVHMQMTELSALISVVRWGITRENHGLVRDTNKNITSVDLANDLSKRLIQGGKGSLKRHSVRIRPSVRPEDANIIIANYKNAMDRVWNCINENQLFFELVYEYNSIKNSLSLDDSKSIFDYGNALNAVHDKIYQCIDNILKEQMKELSERLDALSVYTKTSEEDSRKHIVDGIVMQVYEAIEFNKMREERKNASNSEEIGEENDNAQNSVKIVIDLNKIREEFDNTSNSEEVKMQSSISSSLLFSFLQGMKQAALVLAALVIGGLVGAGVCLAMSFFSTPAVCIAAGAAVSLATAAFAGAIMYRLFAGNNKDETETLSYNTKITLNRKRVTIVNGTFFENNSKNDNPILNKENQCNNRSREMKAGIS